MKVLFLLVINVWITICATSTNDGESVCYKELGCFPNGYPWTSILRPFPSPLNPSQIDTRLYLYTRKNVSESYAVTLWDNISIEGSDFNPQRPYTVFITHGFANNWEAPWLHQLKDAYLKNRDANVFIVDWGKGARLWNYLLVASNTRIVGAEMARFGRYLINEIGLDPSKLHLIGHSLGAHTSAYMAKEITPKIGQITALDPAQPGFEENPEAVRLSKNDAVLVDVIHTNGRPFIPFLGFGLIFPAGHIDYYMNGGLLQPGCVVPPLDEVKITGIADLAKYPVEVVASWVGCSHSKAYLYYIEALSNIQCTFWGKSDGVIGTAAGVGTFGIANKVLEKLSNCNLEKCLPLGLDALIYPARGVFFANTGVRNPFCLNDPQITTSMKQQRGLLLTNETSVSTEKTHGMIGNVLGGIFG